MYKRIMIAICLSTVILSISACTARNEEASSQVIREPASTSEFASSLQNPQSDIEDDSNRISDSASVYQLLAADIIAQYSDHSIETNDTFSAMPEDFEFPDEISDLEFLQNEMGCYITSITDKNDAYKMYITIDNMTYNGEKTEESPHVSAVFFDKIA